MNRNNVSTSFLAVLHIAGATFTIVAASTCFSPFTADAFASAAITAFALAFVIACVAPTFIADPSFVAVTPRPFEFALPFPFVIVVTIVKPQLHYFPYPFLAPKQPAAAIDLVVFVRPFIKF